MDIQVHLAPCVLIAAPSTDPKVVLDLHPVDPVPSAVKDASQMFKGIFNKELFP